MVVLLAQRDQYTADTRRSRHLYPVYRGTLVTSALLTEERDIVYCLARDIDDGAVDYLLRR
jgi:hypothetical protein